MSGIRASKEQSPAATGVLYDKLGLGTAAELEAAEREITHAALILLDESPVSPSYDLRATFWPSPHALVTQRD